MIGATNSGCVLGCRHPHGGGWEPVEAGVELGRAEADVRRGTELRGCLSEWLPRTSHFPPSAPPVI